MDSQERLQDTQARAEVAFGSAYGTAIGKYFFTLGSKEHREARLELSKVIADGLYLGTKAARTINALLGVMEGLNGQLRKELETTQEYLLDFMHPGSDAPDEQFIRHKKIENRVRARARVPFE